MKVDDLIRDYNIEIDENEFYIQLGKDKNYNIYREWIEDEIISIIESYKNQSKYTNINEFIYSIYQE